MQEEKQGSDDRGERCTAGAVGRSPWQHAIYLPSL
jgi:hypothetical protein